MREALRQRRREVLGVPRRDQPRGKPRTFKRLLLDKAVKEFEEFQKNSIQEQIDALVEGTDAQKAVKTRMLGSIRFIGELYKQRMLPEKIIHECVIKLLGDIENPEEDVVECLCVLMSTVGPDIDREKGRRTWTSTSRGCPTCRMQWRDIASLLRSKDSQCRLWLMLEEVIDLRKSGWKATAKHEERVAAQAGAEVDWSDREVEALKAACAKYTNVTPSRWTKVAAEVGGGRTGDACKKKRELRHAASAALDAMGDSGVAVVVRRLREGSMSETEKREGGIRLAEAAMSNDQAELSIVRHGGIAAIARLVRSAQADTQGADWQLLQDATCVLFTCLNTGLRIRSTVEN